MISKLSSFLGPFWQFIKARKLRLVVFLLIVGGGGYFGYKHFFPTAQAVQYQTAVTQKGTLITNVSGSGTISSGSSVDIKTDATGVVTYVYVNNGDTVTQGQKIASLALDQSSQQKLASAWANYLSAQNSLKTAQSKLNSLQSAAFKANQKFITDAAARGLTIDDPTYIQENADWKQAEADYTNQGSTITQAQASVSSSWLAYQQISSDIVAPATGVVTNAYSRHASDEYR
jgi:HlyD family secretion protein